MKILAARLRQLRKETEMRQTDVAKALGLSLNGYQRYETDVREPTAPVLAAMADLFQVSTDYLLGRTDQK